MLCVDERADAAALLGLGQHVQRQRGLARAFRPENFDDTPARQPTDAQRDIETERARGNRFDID